MVIRLCEGGGDLWLLCLVLHILIDLRVDAVTVSISRLNFKQLFVKTSENLSRYVRNTTRNRAIPHDNKLNYVIVHAARYRRSNCEVRRGCGHVYSSVIERGTHAVIGTCYHNN